MFGLFVPLSGNQGSMEKSIKTLQSNFPQVGKIDWISIRLKKRGEVKSLEEVQVNESNGLEGDHYAKKGNRMVTLIQAEHLTTDGQLLGIDGPADPSLTRRNIVVSGINLVGLKDAQFRIGDDVILQTTGLCYPCSRMEENFGDGGYHAMRGHGGITTKVIQGGHIKVGDTVRFVAEVPSKKEE